VTVFGQFFLLDILCSQNDSSMCKFVIFLRWVFLCHKYNQALLLVGAVFIKNYASLDKNEKSTTCFFQSLPIKVLKKFVHTHAYSSNQIEN
jgi:hypothetical protein